MRETSLRDIPGIGPTRARTLLTRFGSISGIAAAQPREIEEAVGVSAARAVLSYLEAGRSREEAGTTEIGSGEGGHARSA